MSSTESVSVSALVDRLAAVEKRLAEVVLQREHPPIAKTTLAANNPTEKKDNPGEAGLLSGDDNNKKEDPQPVSRVKVVINRTDPDTGEAIEENSKLQTSQDKDVNNDKYAFILRKNVQDSNDSGPSSSEIEITSSDLWALLKNHLGHYPYHIFRGSPVTLSSPYEAIIFQFDDLLLETQKVPENDNDKQTRDDLKLLLDTISSGSSGDERLDKYFKMRPNYKKQDQETIQFEDLWTIFPPGTLVYGGPFQGQPQVFVVKDNWRPWPWPKSDTGRAGGNNLEWYLDAWSYDWRDGSFSRNLLELDFEPFDGHLPLTSLPFYPFKLHPDYDIVRAELIERGKQFRKICEAKEGSRLFEYKGKTIFERKGFLAMRNADEDAGETYSSSSYILNAFQQVQRYLPAKSSDVDSRVMVDYESYFQYGAVGVRNGPLKAASGADCLCSDCHQNAALGKRYRRHFDETKFVRMKDWEEEQYLICPPRVLGYILKDKQWAQLQVSLLFPIVQHDSNALLSRLKLADDGAGLRTQKGDNSTKTLLLDLVRSHTSTTTYKDAEDKESLDVDDIIPGKGKGLIILLYGPPGVGKTSTAETIAIATGKALFSVSVADVGTQAKHVESNLARIFALATKWQAILLIDEADVFLESRGRGNAIRSTDKNALVSVFLRVLEYYQGIMFLTTNQIAEFDVAIPSRIHLAIRYESLKREQMDAIFCSFLDDLDKQGLIEDYEQIKDWLDDVVYKEQFDGRQIRNMVTTALGLARAEAHSGGRRQLNKNHMKRAFSNMSAFKRDFNRQMQRYIDGQEKMIK
ncbi:AAA family ATPase [Fusarium albosuccineum]|uniref:AAA family ATPase n=1 Tax=Fusarium albosuccineum TaxID=1237068 RepID=A0A8H4P541_9HYPO|nr:AAA family ATPase [Fusarium albosuccineum]